MTTPLRRGPYQAGPVPDLRPLPAPSTPASGQEEIRRQNLSALLRHLHVSGPTSRTELSGLLNLNRSTIGALAADLVAADLATEEAPTTGRRAGRPSLVVSPCSERVWVRVATIESERLCVARVGLGGLIMDQRESPRPPGATPLDTVTELAALIGQAERDLGPDTVCAGGTVAVANTVHELDGTIHVTGADERIAAALDAALGLGAAKRPGFVTTDLAGAAVLAEHVRGVAVGLDDVVYLHGDQGVSAGIITGGRLVTGRGGRSGQVGHMVVHPDGRRCGCGARGCWETEVGVAALLRAASVPAGTCPRAVLRAAARGDTVARAALTAVAGWLGLGVANLVNLFNPDIVVFGGTLRELYTASATHIRRRVDTAALPVSREHLQLRAGALGADAALIGAAELAFEKLLTDPLKAPVPG
jgi:predicted NBD/HSP70 family sugar kinase